MRLGRISTVRILLRNPFDEPVEILEIKGPRSSYIQEAQKEFIELAQNQDPKEGSKQSSYQGGKKISEKILNTLSGVSFSE